MKVVSQFFHVWEFSVRLNAMEFPATYALPSIVYIDVGPSIVDQTFFYHGLGRTHHLVLAHAVAPAVPTVPSHGRSESNFLTYFNAEVAFSFAQTVGCIEFDMVGPCFFDTATDKTRLGIKGQSFG